MTLSEQCCTGCTLRGWAIAGVIVTAINATAFLIIGILCLYGISFSQTSKGQMTIAILCLVFLCLSILILSFLIASIVQNRSVFVLPWLIGFLIEVLLIIIFTILYSHDSGVIGACLFLLNVSYIIIWMFVLLYYRALREGFTSYIEI